MKEKLTMSSIMMVTYADVGSTILALSKGASEVGFMGSGFYENGHMMEAYAIKIGVSAAFVMIYALTAKNSETNDWAWGYDKIMKIISVAMWYYPVANIVNLLIPG